MAKKTTQGASSFLGALALPLFAQPAQPAKPSESAEIRAELEKAELRVVALKKARKAELAEQFPAMKQVF